MSQTSARQKRKASQKRAAAAARLTEEQIAVLERLLLKERARVLRSSAELQALVDVGDLKLRGDFADVSLGISTRENASLLASRAGDQFRTIEEALKRLRNDPAEFERCSVCQTPIPFERLELIPTTRTCQAHAS